MHSGIHLEIHQEILLGIFPRVLPAIPPKISSKETIPGEIFLQRFGDSFRKSFGNRSSFLETLPEIIVVISQEVP